MAPKEVTKEAGAKEAPGKAPGAGEAPAKEAGAGKTPAKEAGAEAPAKAANPIKVATESEYAYDYRVNIELKDQFNNVFFIDKLHYICSPFIYISYLY